MPEANYGMFWPSSEPPKKAPIIKISCGIGDTDGFPAFDVDSDAYATKDDSRWGFLITGGAEFHMPLTVFQVTPDGLADKNGVRLGDIILDINEEDATQLTLAQAHEKIEASGKKIQFLLKNMEEDDPMGMYAAGEEKSIVMRVPKPMPPPPEFNPTPLLGSRCWHPIMWHDPPEPPKPKKKKTKTEIDEEGNEVVIELSDDESSDEEEEELPHHRIIRNIRRFFAEVGENTDLKNSTIENMLLALPTAARTDKETSSVLRNSEGRMSAISIEARLRAMQRKLSAIAEIPKILSSTLATVSQTFDKLMPMDLIETQNQHKGYHLKKMAGYEHRKCSYDEDAIDYELTAVLEESDEYEDTESEENDRDDNNFDEDKENVYMESDDLGAKSFKSMLKDVTPESDYASEANYTENGMSEEEQSILDDDDNGIDYGDVNDNNKNKEEVVPNNDTASNSIDNDDDDDNASEDVDREDEVQAKNLENDKVIEEEDDTTSDNEVVFYLKLPERIAAEFAAVSHDEVASNQHDEDYDELNTDDDDDEEDEDEDFLSTTYTWNLRNTPKLRLNDAYDEIDLTLNAEPKTVTQKPEQFNIDNCDNSIDNNDDDDGGVATLSTNDDDAGVVALSSNDNDEVDDSVSTSKQQQMTQSLHDDDKVPAEAPQKVLFRLDSVERSWPWADRERIIYKQSTCHLVPRKPLGLIEKRIQLLAKQNLLEKLQAADAK